MAHIFLSYARADKDHAERLAKALADSGWDVWWDQSILPGESYRKEILAQIKAAACTVVLWSHRAVESDWVIDEAEVAKAQEKLVQAAVEGVEPPIGFRQLQCSSLMGWNGDVAARDFAKLHAGISRFLPPKQGIVEEPHHATAVAPPRVRERSNRAWLIGAGAIFLLLAAALVLRTPQSASSDAAEQQPSAAQHVPTTSSPPDAQPTPPPTSQQPTHPRGRSTPKTPNAEGAAGPPAVASDTPRDTPVEQPQPPTIAPSQPPAVAPALPSAEEQQRELASRARAVVDCIYKTKNRQRAIDALAKVFGIRKVSWGIPEVVVKELRDTYNRGATEEQQRRMVAEITCNETP